MTNYSKPIACVCHDVAYFFLRKCQRPIILSMLRDRGTRQIQDRSRARNVKSDWTPFRILNPAHYRAIIIIIIIIILII